MEIVIVTFARDFSYLQYCLKSIDKFVRGIECVTILIPSRDLPLLLDLTLKWNIKTPVRIKTMDEWPNAGFLHHMYSVMITDMWRCGNTPHCAHIDADCVFVEPASPDDYFRDGKPILRYEEFSSLCARHPAHGEWEKATKMCLPFPVKYETMRAHPAVYHVDTYPQARNQMRVKTGEDADLYIRRQKNSYPQTFCEFVTLGNVAMNDQPHLYTPVRQNGDCPDPDNKVIQFHAPDPIHLPQDIWIKGRQQVVTPIEVIKKLGLV